MPRTSPDAGSAFLASAALGAVNTANARRPLSRTGRVSVLSFFPGWITSEMPLHAIGWQALATLGLLAALGRMAFAGLSFSPAGISVLLLALLTGGFLVLCIKSFVDARRRQRKPEQ